MKALANWGRTNVIYAAENDVDRYSVGCPEENKTLKTKHIRPTAVWLEQFGRCVRG